MDVKTFIPKDNHELPDYYVITVYYYDGKKEEIEVVSQQKIQPNINMLECFTKEDKVIWIPLSSVKKIEFDKNFTKVLELNAKYKTQNIESKDNPK